MKIGGDLQGEPIIFLTLEADADGKGLKHARRGGCKRSGKEMVIVPTKEIWVEWIVLRRAPGNKLVGMS